MSRDYAGLHRVNKKYPYYKKKQPSSKSWLWLLLLIVIFGVGVIYLKHHHAQKVARAALLQIDNVQNKQKSSKLKDKTTGNNQATIKDANAQPEFDFYTLLPKSKVMPDEPVSTKGQFILHVMTLSNQAAAEHEKMQLGLFGLDAKVEKIVTSTGAKYKVIVGPYSSKKAAENDQVQMKANKIDCSLESSG
jgi:cell division protein FtsN